MDSTPRFTNIYYYIYSFCNYLEPIHLFDPHFLTEDGCWMIDLLSPLIKIKESVPVSPFLLL